MSDEIDMLDPSEFVTIKEAARMLHMSYGAVNEYVREGRLKAIRVGSGIAIPIEAVKTFKPKLTGRPRASIPIWRISPDDSILSTTLIYVNIRTGKHKDFTKKLEEIRDKREHLFPGTVNRYMMLRDSQPQRVEITLVWRSQAMPDPVEREKELEAFRRDLADVLDWSTATYDAGTIIMHA